MTLVSLARAFVTSRVIGPVDVQIVDNHAVVHFALWPVGRVHRRPHRSVGALQVKLAVGGVERLGALLALVLDRLELGDVLVGGDVILEVTVCGWRRDWPEAQSRVSALHCWIN